MRFLKNLFVEHCPKCNKVLETHHSNTLKSIIIKSCPEQHYQKEFHPALETYIETHKVS
ncbi:MAG: hypothetical protein ABGX20_12050 [Bacillus sp. (in: firmicutes)]